MDSTDFDIYPIIAQGMSSNLHWCRWQVNVEEISKIMIGMANANGGTIYLGIDADNGKIEGVQDIQATRDLVFQACLLCDPTLVVPVPKIRSIRQEKILEITIPQGMPHVFNLEGAYFQREGRLTRPIPPRRLRQLLVERGVLQFESLVPEDASFQDLDPEQVNEYGDAYYAALNLPERDKKIPIEQILTQRGCLKQVDGELRPTYAALLLFGRTPQRWLPTAQILATRFSGTSFGDRFVKQEINGSLPQQLQGVAEFLTTNLQQVVRMVGLKHQETLEYPFSAIRELLINAVAHRDYNAQGDCIHLNVFSNQLEVTSPGGLPGPITIDNLLKARFSRNPVIVQILADLGYVERLGYGLDRVVQAMREESLPAPVFEDSPGVFRVTLRNEPDESLSGTELSQSLLEELNPRQISALNYIGSRKRITNRAYQDLCPEVHPETLRRDLADLVSRGVLLKIGDKKSTYYILK